MSVTDKMIRQYHRITKTFPNVQMLDIRPGTVLTVSRQNFAVDEPLSAKITDAGDSALKDKVSLAIENRKPRQGVDGDPTVEVYMQSEGTTLACADSGVNVELPDGTNVKAQIKLAFSGASDFYFDTAAPAYWFTFSPEEMSAINKAALKYVEPGAFVVVGASWTTHVLLYVSHKSNTQIGFNVDTSVSEFVGRGLAGLQAAGSVKGELGFSSSLFLRQSQLSMVASFACIKVTDGVFTGPHIKATRLRMDGSLEHSLTDGTEKRLLIGASADDLFDPGVFSSTDR